MIAPLLGGSLLAIDSSLPVYASIGTFVAAGICVVLLNPPENEDAGDGGGGVMH
jgi:hypothetical protein